MCWGPPWIEEWGSVERDEGRGEGTAWEELFESKDEWFENDTEGNEIQLV